MLPTLTIVQKPKYITMQDITVKHVFMYGNNYTEIYIKTHDGAVSLQSGNHYLNKDFPTTKNYTDLGNLQLDLQLEK